jgi:hypothetical protein
MNSRPLTGIRDIRAIQLGTLACSVLLSLLALWLNEQPNNDAYTYVRAAEIALRDGIADAYGHYDWAHFSVLIAAVHRLTGMSLFNAANLINTLLFAVISVVFVNLCAALAYSRRAVWLAAAVILLYPHLNEFRPYIIRDTGFLAFMLIGVLQLVWYNQAHRLRHGLGFIAATLIATLFRPEALIFLATMPAALLINHEHAVSLRRAAWLRLNGILASVLVLVLIVFAASPIQITSQLEGFSAIYAPFLGNLEQLIGINSTQLNNSLFGEYAAQYVGNYTGWFLLAGLVALLLACIVDSLGLAVAPLLAYGLMRRYVSLPQHAAKVLAATLLTAFLILLAFTLLTRFVTTRYTLLLCVLLLTMLPFIIDRLWSLAAAQGRLSGFGVLMAVLALYSALAAHVSFGASKAHIEAGNAWIVQYTRANAPLITNEFYIAYQSQRVPDYDRTQRDIEKAQLANAVPGTIIAVTPRRGTLALIEARLESGELRLLQRFAAERGADLYILEKEL